MSPASPRLHGRPRNAASASAYRALSVLALCLFAFAAFRDTSSAAATTKSAPVYLTSSGSRKVRAFAEPWFCHGGPCAPFADLPKRGGPGYEARAYEPATYVAVNVTAINAEVALAEGLLLIERYSRGANTANASVPRGAPALVVLRPTGDDYAGLAPAFSVAAYLPPAPSRTAHPAPTDDGVFLAARPPATTYALPFGGFARGGVALANAARLALALTRAGAPFEAGSPFGLALYDPPTRWAGRHNEVWVWAAGDGWDAGASGGGGGGGSGGRAAGLVATHL